MWGFSALWLWLFAPTNIVHTLPTLPDNFTMAPSVSDLPAATQDVTNGVAKLNIKEQVKQEQVKQDVGTRFVTQKSGIS